MFKTLAKELYWCRVDVDGEKRALRRCRGLWCDQEDGQLLSGGGLLRLKWKTGITWCHGG